MTHQIGEKPDLSKNLNMFVFFVTFVDNCGFKV